MNGRADLPPPLLEKLDAFVLGHPDREALIERLFKKRAAADTQRERDAIEKMLRSVASPSRAGWYIALAVGLFVVAVFGLLRASGQNHLAAVAAGEKVVARVERLDSGNCWVGTKTSLCVHLVLELHPTGRERYRGELNHDISNLYLSRVQPGAWLTVAVDRADKSKVYIDEESLALPSPDAQK